MTKPDELRELAERCEAGETYEKVFSDCLPIFFPEGNDQWQNSKASQTTNQHGQVAALEKELLPDLVYKQGGCDCKGVYWYEICNSVSDIVEVEAPTEPLARLAALCRAYADKLEGEDQADENS